MQHLDKLPFLSIVPHSLVVQSEIGGTLPGGPKKLIFLIREIDDAAMAGASVESCRFVVREGPRGRIGSVLDVGNRLRRMRERASIGGYTHYRCSAAQIYIYIYIYIYPPKSFRFRAPGSPQAPQAPPHAA